MTKRPNLLVILGAALFVIGAAIVFLVLRSSDDGESAAGNDLVPVLVATNDLAIGESGDAILASGRVVVKQVPLSERGPDAITAAASLAGQTIGAPVPEGQQVPGGSLRAPNLRSTAIEIPKGKQAVAVTVSFTSGAAGYAAAGDRINVYSIVQPDAPNATPSTVPAVGAEAAAAPDGTAALPPTPFTKLLLSNVEVLDVSTELAPRVTAAAAGDESTATATGERLGSSTLTVLLALDAQQAEQVIFATSVNQLYFTVLPKGQGESTTEGVGYGRNYPLPATSDEADDQ